MRLALPLTVALVAAAAAVRPPETELVPVSPRPFKVGEELTFSAKVNFLNAGTATLKLASVESMRGHATFHSVLDLSGRVLFMRIADHTESWFDTTTFSSVKLSQFARQGGRTQSGEYEFFPERGVYVRNGEERPSAAAPLDELSLLYYIRALPLQVGKTYTINRYYHLDRNPITVTVLRREHVEVAAGAYDALVVHPVVKSKGLFSEGGNAEVWLSDDASRLVLKLNTGMPVGTLHLELKSAQR